MSDVTRDSFTWSLVGTLSASGTISQPLVCRTGPLMLHSQLTGKPIHEWLVSLARPAALSICQGFCSVSPKSLLPEGEMLVKMRSMKLIFLHGPPAVGKLTVARELAALTGFRLFHNHLTVDLVTSLFPFGSEAFVNLREQIWLAAFAEAARHEVSLIFTFNPERTVRERFVDDAVRVVKENGGEIVFVALTCAESELEGRMEDASRKEFGKLASVELYRSLKEAGAFSFPELPEDLAFDTSKNSAFENAKLIAERLDLR